MFFLSTDLFFMEIIGEYFGFIFTKIQNLISNFEREKNQLLNFSSLYISRSRFRFFGNK